MELPTIIIISIVALFLVIRLSKNVNPSSKTDDQLKWMYNIAMKSRDPTKPQRKDFALIEEEMEKRGFIPKSSVFSSGSDLSSSDRREVNEAIKQVEESGILNQMHDAIDDEIPKNIFNKTLEIAQIKCITEAEASSYFNREFEDASSKYKDMGLSEIEADKKALYDTLAMNVEQA